MEKATVCTSSVGVDLEGNCLYLQHRELIHKANGMFVPSA